MTDGENTGGGQSPLEARRTKLQQIEALGHDPWGHRFDDRQMAGDIRQRAGEIKFKTCLLYTSPSPRDKRQSRMPSSA